VDEQQEVLGEERLDDELGVVDREVDDRRVELAGEHAGHDRGGAALADDRVDARVFGGDGGEELRHEPAGGRADHPDAGVAGDVVVERGDVGGDVVDLVEHAPSPLDHPLALVGEDTVRPVDEHTPSSRSSLATWPETLDCTVYSARAAAEKVPWSATATIAASWRTSISRDDTDRSSEK
jgi:hypothetical protein